MTAALGTVALWTIWLVLLVALIFQTVVAVRREFAVPQWVLEGFARRLESAGIGARFGAATFDPTGNLLIQDVSLSLPTFEEPIIVVPAAYLRLDPWLLLVGRVDVTAVKVSGATWFVPAMLSQSGKSEAVLNDLDLSVRADKADFVVDNLTAKIAGVAVSAHGAFQLPPARGRPPTKQAAATAFAQNYAAFCRRVGAFAEQLSGFDSPRLQIELQSSEARGADVTGNFFARSAKLSAPVPLAADDLAVTVRGGIAGAAAAPAELTVTCGEIRSGPEIAATHLWVSVRGMLRPGDFSFSPSLARITLDTATGQGLQVTGLSAEATPPFQPTATVALLGGIFDEPVAVAAALDYSKRSAQVSFRAAVAPQWLDVVTEKLHRNIRRSIDFSAPLHVEGKVAISPGWKFARMSTHLRTEELQASHVVISEGDAEVTIDQNKIFSPDAYARIGENFARGTYEQDLATKDYRFILQGQLRPLAISGWFTGWWKDLFTDIGFPAEVPTASVDIRSRWGSGLESANFVAVDSTNATIRRVPFAKMRTSLFIRPGNLEGLWVEAHQPASDISGTFSYRTDLNTGEWTELRINGTSTASLTDIAQLLGPDSSDWLKPFQSDRPPTVQVRGLLTRDSERETHPQLEVHTLSRGTFRFYNFPIENVSFDAALHNDDIKLDNFSATFAEGTGAGHGHLWGNGSERRLGFDLEMKDANLAQAVSQIEAYLALRHERTSSTPGSFFQERAQVRASLAISAEGKLADPYSFHGNGNTAVGGIELGEVHLLGGLSQLLRFTTLRFTDARSNFRVDGKNLVFPDVTVTGANSAIRGAGHYDLENDQLDFSARVFPFRESGFILQKFLAVALSPLSSTFEVKLSGTLEKPVWNLAMGGNSVLRDLPPAPLPSPTTPFRVAPTP